MKIDYYKENANINLFAFIGEKISIEEFNPNTTKQDKIEIDPKTGDTLIRKSYVIDRAFKLKYKVVKNLYNDLKVDTIEFVAYDHYGIPNFAEFKNVILYISKSQDDKYYYHQKYQFNAIYKTKENEWIGLLNFGNRYLIDEGKKLILKKIKLDKIANVDIKNMRKVYVEYYYPEPFYKIKKNNAIPILGLPINDLLKYKIKNIIDANNELIEN
ncbi:hypothetical protein [Flavobacterium koreense]